MPGDSRLRWMSSQNHQVWWEAVTYLFIPWSHSLWTVASCRTAAAYRGFGMWWQWSIGFVWQRELITLISTRKCMLKLDWKTRICFSQSQATQVILFTLILCTHPIQKTAINLSSHHIGTAALGLFQIYYAGWGCRQYSGQSFQPCSCSTLTSLWAPLLSI